ncbi:MFS transporter [Nocardia sp. NPDC049526]|uniref:MFS transporter n=1 Tax=Nocardia sp. NPDC049526 TaxID=3364316 RepID=UPI003793FBA8
MNTPAPATRPGGILAVLATAGIVASLMATLVMPLLGELPQLLHTTSSNATWVVTITLLVGAVITPVAGRLGDLYGKRKILLASIVPLIAGSLVCAVATSIVPMIIGRGLQGAGVGIIPLGISALRDLLPPERLGAAIALISSSLGIGAAMGLPLSAAVVEYSNWRVLFWGSAALAALVGVLIFAVIPDTPNSGAAGRFDALGAIGLGAGLVSLLLAISKGAAWGWTSAGILGLFIAAVVLLLVWGWWELRIDAPLVDLRVTARPQVLLTNAASVVVGIAMYSQSLVMPQLLQLPTATGYGLGQSMMAMGLWMAPAGVVMMLISPVGAKLSAARGPKFTLVTGCLIIAVGYAASMALMGSTWGMLAVTVIISAGTGFAYGAMPALIMGAVPVSETAAANSFNTLMRSVGTSAAAAVIGAVLAQMTVSMGGHAIPTENGFRVALLIGCGVAVLGAAISATIPTRRTPDFSEPAITAEPVAVRV